MIEGRVKVWKPIEGWVFIERSDGDDYFFNVSNIRKGQKISSKSQVRFDIFQWQKQRGPEARNITLY